MSELSIAESIRQDYEDEIERLKNINEEHRILNGKLRKELQQKENIIKEVREYANNIMFETKAEEKIQDDILEILEKVEE